MQRVDRCRRPVTWLCLLMLLLVGPASLALPELAHAQSRWDPERFIQMLNEANRSFSNGAYARSQQMYLELRWMVEDGLTSGQIPPDQVSTAENALSIIQYQIGRCQQLTGDCSSALSTYQSLQDLKRIDDEVRLKLPPRLAATLLCDARRRLDRGDVRAAAIGLDACSELLNTVDEDTWQGQLNDETASELDADLETTRRDRDALQREVFDRQATRAQFEASSGECRDAWVALSFADRYVDDDSAARLDELRQTVRRGCDENTGTNPTRDPDAGPPLGPLILVSAGGALLLADLLFEVAHAGTVDDFGAARDACVDGRGRCQESLDLASDIDTARVVSASLLTIGLLSVAGGVAWWLLDHEPSAAHPDDPLVPAASLSPLGTQGAMLELRWTLP